MPIVVQNHYYIRAGLEQRALAVRRDASEVRRAEGRPAGRILLPVTPETAGPAFIWECDYPDHASRERDAAWADGSAAFSAVRERMGALLERFERITFEVDAG
jgi:hypothetical protein